MIMSKTFVPLQARISMDEIWQAISSVRITSETRTFKTSNSFLLLLLPTYHRYTAKKFCRCDDCKGWIQDQCYFQQFISFHVNFFSFTITFCQFQSFTHIKKVMIEKLGNIKIQKNPQWSIHQWGNFAYNNIDFSLHLLFLITQNDYGFVRCSEWRLLSRFEIMIWLS